MICDESSALFKLAATQAQASQVFAQVSCKDGALICAARDVEPSTCYRVDVDPKGDKVWVGLFTPDRWLSESIETDLLHLGDKLEDLLEEELYDQGYETRLVMEHFRDDAKQYVFRSPVLPPENQKLDSQAMADRVARVLLAYQAMFRELGDMSPDEED